MKKIDLIYCVPEKLAEEASLDELLHTAKCIEKWEERHAEVLDYIYRQRLIWLLTRRASIDELSAFAEHLERMLHPRRLDAIKHLEKRYAERWMAIKDIAESRLASLRSEAPQQVLNLAHVKEILDLIDSGPARRQSEIEKSLGLRRPNLTRVLNLMEANELIERRSEGREKLVSPGAGLEHIRQGSTPGGKRQPRWASCFSKASCQ